MDTSHHLRFVAAAAAGTTFEGALTTVVLTDRYFRAVAKIGFHYFLTQFREFNGDEDLFSGIREYILTDGQAVDKANESISKRQHPLLGEMPKIAADQVFRNEIGATTEFSMIL